MFCVCCSSFLSSEMILARFETDWGQEPNNSGGSSMRPGQSAYIGDSFQLIKHMRRPYCPQIMTTTVYSIPEQSLRTAAPLGAVNYVHARGSCNSDEEILDPVGDSSPVASEDDSPVNSDDDGSLHDDGTHSRETSPPSLSLKDTGSFDDDFPSSILKSPLLKRYLKKRTVRSFIPIMSSSSQCSIYRPMNAKLLRNWHSFASLVHATRFRWHELDV